MSEGSKTLNPQTGRAHPSRDFTPRKYVSAIYRESGLVPCATMYPRAEAEILSPSLLIPNSKVGLGHRSACDSGSHTTYWPSRLHLLWDQPPSRLFSGTAPGYHALQTNNDRPF